MNHNVIWDRIVQTKDAALIRAEVDNEYTINDQMAKLKSVAREEQQQLQGQREASTSRRRQSRSRGIVEAARRERGADSVLALRCPCHRGANVTLSLHYDVMPLVGMLKLGQ